MKRTVTVEYAIAEACHAREQTKLLPQHRRAWIDLSPFERNKLTQDIIGFTEALHDIGLMVSTSDGTAPRVWGQRVEGH